MQSIPHLSAAGANAFGSFGRSLLGAESVDVDACVTSHALGGLFKRVADEETPIRHNPVFSCPKDGVHLTQSPTICHEQ